MINEVNNNIKSNKYSLLWEDLYSLMKEKSKRVVNCMKQKNKNQNFDQHFDTAVFAIVEEQHVIEEILENMQESIDTKVLFDNHCDQLKLHTNEYCEKVNNALLLMGNDKDSKNRRVNY